MKVMVHFLEFVEGAYMLKKIRYACLITVFFLAGCGHAVTSNYNNVMYTVTDNIEHFYNDATIDGDEHKTANCLYPFSLFIANPQNDAAYTLSSSIFEECGIWVSYPQIEMDDAEKQAKINNLLEYRMNKIIGWRLELEGQLSLEMSYEIKIASDRLLSVAFSGLGFVQGAARPFHIYQAINVNVLTGEEIILSDVINIDERLIELLLSDNAVFLDSNSYVQDYLKEIISRDSFLYRLQAEESTHFYLTKDSLGLIIDVLHVLGGFAVIEVMYDYLWNK